MGVEVSRNDSVINMGAEQGVQVCPASCWAAGDWKDIDVDDVKLSVIN